MANILASPVAFIHMLNTCAISQRSRDVIVTDEGINTLNALCYLSKKELDDMVSGINKAYKTISRANERCSIGTMVLKRIHAVRLWAKDALIEGQKIMPDNQGTLNLLTEAWRDDICNIYLSPESEETDTSSNIDKVDFDGTNWYDARRSILDIISSKKGAKGISLSYIVRATNGAWDNDYETLEERRIACYRHSGPGFVEDNKAVYHLLVQYFSKTSCNDVVRTYEKSKNGKAAWNAIKKHNEGGGFKQQLIQEANEMIARARFTGNARYGLEDYFKIHVRCHLMLAESGQPMGEFQKITTFMANISDPGIKQDYKTVRSNQTLMASFQSLFNHLYEGHRIDHPEGVPSKNNFMPNNRKRNINQMQGQGNNDTRSGRGRGRSGRGSRGGRSGRGGRGGRGRGRNNSSKTSLPASIRQDPHATIAPDTWHALSYEQKNAVFVLRENTNKLSEDARTVNSLNSNNVDDGSDKEKHIGQPSRASNAFGSRKRGNN